MVCRYLSLSFPQMVVVENRGLACIYYGLLLGFLAAYVSMVALLDMWSSRIDMAAHIYPSLDVGDPDELALSDVFREKVHTRLCAPSANDYRAGSDNGQAGRRIYVNHTCVRPCRRGEHPLYGCLASRDTFANEDASQVFLTTHLQEEIVHANSVEKRSAFLPTTEALSVALRYKYHEPGERILQPGGEVRSSDTNVVTVLLNQDGTTKSKFIPGSRISLTVPQLLELAGLRGELDAAQAGFSANLAGGAAPIGRLTGLQLEVMLNCYGGLSGSPACYVRVVKSSEGWVSATQDLPGANGAIVRRELHGLRIRVRTGLRIRVRTGGYLTVFDPGRTLQAAVVGLVILEIPAKLVLLFIMLCLGRLSSIYQDAIFRPFSLPQQVAGLSARLLASTVAFERLGIDGGRATRERILHRIFEAVRDHLPDDENAAPSDDLLRFLDYGWETMAGTNDPAAAKELEEVAGRDTVRSITASQNLRDLPASLAIHDFTSACSSIEPVTVKAWVEFFRDARRGSLVEKIFLPTDIRKRLKSMPGQDRPEYKVSQKTWRPSVTFDAVGAGSADGYEAKSRDVSPELRGGPVETKADDAADQREGASRQEEARDSSHSVELAKPARVTITTRSSTLELAQTHERLEDLADRINSLDSMRGSYVSLDRRVQQLDKSLLQQLGDLEDRVNESMSKLDKRLVLLKDTIKIQIGPIDMTGGGKTKGQASGGRIAILEADSQRQREELDAMKKRQSLILKSIDSAERSISFLAATRSEAETLKLGQPLLGLSPRAAPGSPRAAQSSLRAAPSSARGSEGSAADTEHVALELREVLPGCRLPRGSLGRREGSVFVTTHV